MNRVEKYVSLEINGKEFQITSDDIEILRAYKSLDIWSRAEILHKVKEELAYKSRREIKNM